MSNKWKRLPEGQLIWSAGFFNLMVKQSPGVGSQRHFNWRLYLVGVNGALDDPTKLLDLGHANTERGAMQKASKAALKHLQQTCKELRIRFQLVTRHPGHPRTR